MKAHIRAPRHFTATVPVTKFIQRSRSDLATWPLNLQDKIMEALEACMVKYGLREITFHDIRCVRPTPMSLWHLEIHVIEKLGPDDVRITH